ncbi:MAG TPA: polyphosphate kinase 2 family protein [Stellaceae bacterium]|nr:polyphosphate kinase 2 family protein [Stellaceae bacterium]
MFPKIDLGELERYRVRPAGGAVKLADHDPRDQQGLPLDKGPAKKALKADIAEIDRLQEILYAEAKHALLVVFQGMDASGKDGAVRDVFGHLSPMGAVATSFKKPNEDELAHDFLWRVHQRVPPRRMIGIFNRSHYEDVLIVRVHGLVPPDRIETRYEAINNFEKLLAENGTTIVKFFLHVSKKEQIRRLEARLDDPTKHWKFSPDDLAERKRWNDYMTAYEIALTRCSTQWAPWFIVPADRKWYRDAVVARIVRRTLDGLDLAYPQAMPELAKVHIA